MNDLAYWHALNCVPGLGSQSIQKLYWHFNTMKAAWEASSTDLRAAGLPPAKLRQLIETRNQFQPNQIIRFLGQHAIQAVTLADPDYPPLLKEIYDPPPVLYFKGRLPCPDENPLAVVGSRKYSAYGRRATQTLVRQLAQAGLIIISGLALGIDTFAHQACLAAGRATFAVLSCGLDQCTPPANYQLAQKISRDGGLISEHPPGFPALRQSFHARNRIISGLSLGVVIIESALRSGTLITANHALEQNREVFALPGEIFSPTASGNHRLIQNGAKLITKAEDVLEELNLKITVPAKKPPANSKQPIAPNLNASQRKITARLYPQPLPFDKLAQSTKLKTEVLLAELTQLEIAGLVENIAGQYQLKN